MSVSDEILDYGRLSEVKRSGADGLPSKTYDCPCGETHSVFYSDNGFAQYLYPDGYCEDLNQYVSSERQRRRVELGYG